MYTKPYQAEIVATASYIVWTEKHNKTTFFGDIYHLKIHLKTLMFDLKLLPLLGYVFLFPLQQNLQ